MYLLKYSALSCLSRKKQNPNHKLANAYDLHLPQGEGRGKGENQPPLPLGEGWGEGENQPPLPLEEGLGESENQLPLPQGEGWGEGVSEPSPSGRGLG